MALSIYHILSVFKHDNTHDVHYLVLLNFLQVVRVVKFIKTINTIQKVSLSFYLKKKIIMVFFGGAQYRQFNVYIFKGLRVTFVTGMIILWISFAVYYIARNEEEPWLVNAESNKFLVVIHRCFFLFLLFGAIGPPAHSAWILCFEIILINLGYACYFYYSGKCFN